MKYIYLLLFCIFNYLVVQSQPIIGYQQVATGFSSPVDVINAGDSRLFIVEQGGTIKMWNGTSIISTPFLNISSITNFNGEMGLLSAVFHPNYATNRFFFVYYNSANGNINIARYQTKLNNPNEADETSGVVLLSIPKPFTNHNGGKLNFGTDGFLYFGTGDGGSGGDPNNLAQNPTSLLGKMLRIDVNSFTTPPYYTIPATNPFATHATNKREIFSVGLRNPWRWSFDKQNGDMWIADVGQNLWEEVNYSPATNQNNLNYGWRCYEASATYNTSGCGSLSSYISPIFEYGHNITTGGYSITGGYVYRGTEYPFLQGYYFITDYVTKINWLIKSNGVGGWLTYQSNTIAPANISGFGEAIDGTLFALGLNNGTLYKITASNPLPIKLFSFSAKNTNGEHILNWSVNGHSNGDLFIVERSTNNVSFNTIDTLYAINGTNNYVLKQYSNNSSTVFYRLCIKSVDGSKTYSPILSLKNDVATTSIKIYKSFNSISINSSTSINHISISDATGKLLLNKFIKATGFITFDATIFPKGLLLIKVETNQGSVVSKLIN